MKNGNLHRMQKSGHTKKESNDASGNSGRKRDVGPRVRRGGGGHDDDDSVDSHGNVRGLIAYSSDSEYDSTDSGDTDLTPEQRATIRHHARKAAVKARRRIARTLEKEQESSPHGTRIKRKGKKEDTDTEEEAPTPKRGGFYPRRKKVEPEEDSEEEEEIPKRSVRSRRKKEETDTEEETDEEEDDDDEETDEEEDEEEDDEETDDEEDDEPRGRRGPAGISISFGIDGDEDDERMIPKRHNMKKEPAIVKKFVKLMTEPVTYGGIDDQIDQFKALPAEKQEQMIATLEKKPAAAQENLMFKILTMNLPAETQSVVLAKYHALQDMDPGSGEYFKNRAWLEKLTSIPLGIYKQVPVRLEDEPAARAEFMTKAQQCLEGAIYGQAESKLQILQFIASKIANPDARGLSLLLAGPPGIGKTSLIKNGIAKALNWPFQFISLGGDSDASTYTGHQVVYEGSHCGKIVNSFVAAKSMSMVLMFDELDKISTTAKGEEVQNLLVHLTDAVQNADFEDKYLSGIPIDLSKVMFVFSANDLGKIDKVLMDRMIVIELKGYEKTDKMEIAQNFLLPQALKELGLDEKVLVGKEILEYVITEYAGKEAGVRELKRCIEGIVQKINMLRIFNSKDLPFHIPDFQLPFMVKKSHVDLFLKKHEEKIDVSVQRMYL